MTIIGVAIECLLGLGVIRMMCIYTGVEEGVENLLFRPTVVEGLNLKL